MPGFPPEVGLVYALAINAGMLGCAYRLARRISGCPAQRAGDALLLYFAVQYAAVTLPGLVGVLNLWTMTAVAGGLSAAMAMGGRSMKISTATPIERRTLLAGAFFVAGCLTAVIWLQRQLPAAATDALTYHLPTAVQWLRTGRLGLFPAWFFNPANSWSPMAGSTFIAWLVAPVRGDVLARFVQTPPLLLVFFALAQLCRSVGARTTIAILIAAAAVLSRPFLSEAVLCKDDIFLVAFLAAAFAGCAPERLRERGGAARVGIALGLALATKYTALLALPLCMLLIDAPFRAGWRWRQWGVAIGLAALLAGPWYVRNWIVTGDPLYPVDLSIAGHRLFSGIFEVRRSLDLRHARDIWAVLALRYYSIPKALIGVLVLGWAVAVIAHWRALLKDPLKRICLLGPPVGLAVFVACAPYAEVRFLLPSLLLLFAAIALAVGRWRWQWGELAVGVVLAVAMGTSYRYTPAVLEFVGIGVGVAAVGVAWSTLRERHPILREREWMGGTAIAAILGAAVYINWAAYVGDCHAAAEIFWSAPVSYGVQGAVWQYIRTQTPPDATIAYANTHLVYPLLGEDYRHAVVYVPTRHGLESFRQLPRFPDPVAGEQIGEVVATLLDADQDKPQWIEGLAASGAAYLVVMKQGPIKQPAELYFAAFDAAHFENVFENSAGVVYRLSFGGER